MLKPACLVLLPVALNLCFSFAETADNNLTLKEKQQGWELLFDGKVIDKWHTYGYPSVTNGWEVSDGTIHLNLAGKSAWTPNESHDLVTDEEFENYHLKVDWKISKNGNSGVIFNVKEDKATYANTYQTGPEMQVLDNDGHPDARIIKHRAGDLYDLITSVPEMARPVGEWNQAEIMLKKGKLELFLNGKRVVATVMWNDDWKQMVDSSKFKSMPGFGTFKKGKIALQEHGNEVWFKNIKIKKL